MSQPLDANVRFFSPVDSNHVFVVDTDNKLWVESVPFGHQMPPQRAAVDDIVDRVEPVDAEKVFVLDLHGNLWRENARFHAIPLALCSETSGFRKGFGCRDVYPLPGVNVGFFFGYG